VGSVDVSLEESGADGLGGLGVFADLGERELNRTERMDSSRPFALPGSSSSN